jgi:hypothetical protein
MTTATHFRFVTSTPMCGNCALMIIALAKIRDERAPPHTPLPFAAWIALQMRAGVAGMSMWSIP